MLDTFLTVAYEKTAQAKEQADFVELLKKLPNEELQKIASGDGDIKAAFGCDDSFVEKFKGSPLADQAIALEQESLQLDIAQQQKNLERKNEAKNDDIYEAQDKLRVRKKLLELELAKQQLGGMTGAATETPVPGQGAQGSGALGDMAPEGVQDGAVGGVGSKTAGRFTGSSLKGAPSTARAKDTLGRVGQLLTGSRKAALQDASDAAYTRSKGMGQQVGPAAIAVNDHRDRIAKLRDNEGAKVLGTRVGVGAAALSALTPKKSKDKEKDASASHIRKIAEAQALTQVGFTAGATLAKMALDMGALLHTAKTAVTPLAQKAVHLAAQHPAATGAALGAGVGAAGGAMAGGPNHRLSGALGGAAMGGAAGGAAGAVGGKMMAGAGLADAAKGVVQDVKGMGTSAMNKLKGPSPTSGTASPGALVSNNTAQNIATRGALAPPDINAFTKKPGMLSSVFG